MQFIKCTREALLKPLQTVGGIVEGRQTLPILANVLIQKATTITASELNGTMLPATKAERKSPQ